MWRLSTNRRRPRFLILDNLSHQKRGETFLHRGHAQQFGKEKSVVERIELVNAAADLRSETRGYVHGGDARVEAAVVVERFHGCAKSFQRPGRVCTRFDFDGHQRLVVGSAKRNVRLVAEQAMKALGQTEDLDVGHTRAEDAVVKVGGLGRRVVLPDDLAQFLFQIQANNNYQLYM